MSLVEYDDNQIKVITISWIALLLSIPFHVILIIVLVRYRKKDEFSSPFFHMLLSLSINDLLVAIFVSFTYFLVSMFPKLVVQYMTPLINIISEGFYVGGLAGDTIILVGIGINRFVSYMFVGNQVWRPVHTKCVIGLQWFYSLSVGLSTVHPNMHATYDQNQTTEVLMESFPDSMEYQIKTLVTLLISMCAGLTLCILYTTCVGRLLYYKLTVDTGQVTHNYKVEAWLTFQGFMLSSSMVVSTALVGYMLWHSWLVPTLIYNLNSIFATSNFVLGPFIAILMSGVIQKHIKQMFKPNNNVVAVLPATGNNANH